MRGVCTETVDKREMWWAAGTGDEDVISCNACVLKFVNDLEGFKIVTYRRVICPLL